MRGVNHLVFGHNAAIAEWVAKKIPHVGKRGFPNSRAIGIAASDHEDAKFLGGIVYHNYNAEFRTCQISMASTSPLWAKPATVRALLSVPFEQYKCFKIYTIIPSDNERALRFNRGIGMKSEATLRHQFGRRRHAMVFGMTWDEYAARWRIKEAA